MTTEPGPKVGGKNSWFPGFAGSDFRNGVYVSSGFSGGSKACPSATYGAARRTGASVTMTPPPASFSDPRALIEMGPRNWMFPPALTPLAPVAVKPRSRASKPPAAKRSAVK